MGEEEKLWGSERQPANYCEIRWTVCDASATCFILETKLKLATNVLNFAKGDRGVRLAFSSIQDCLQNSKYRLTNT